jgi:hypothetical protein
MKHFAHDGTGYLLQRLVLAKGGLRGDPPSRYGVDIIERN